MLELFAGWNAHVVFGNNDDDWDGLNAAAALAGVATHGRSGTLDLAGRKIAFVHGHVTRDLRDFAESGLYDFVFHGHTHAAMTHRLGRTLVVNPGASTALARSPSPR